MEEKILTENGMPEESGRKRIVKKLDNFWYHYKWHSIVALFLVFVITVCSLQMCKKEDYDVYFMYAGGKYISRQTENGNFCEYDVINSSLKQVSRDYDENGEVSVSFYDLYMLSSEEIKELEDVNHAYLNNNNNSFRDAMSYSEYYVCFLSESLYREYAKTEGVFMPLKSYTGEGDYRYLDDCAVYLHSEELKFSTLPGICDLPEDTVICMRAKTALSSYFNQKEEAEQFRRGEECLKAIFAYGK